MPVVLDEVFTGLFRIGGRTGGELAGIRPDIACYAKILTAGALPMAVTLATEDVFAAFDGTSKVREG